MGSTKFNVIALLAFTLYAHVVSGQENAFPKIPSSLLECYQNRTLLHREQRLPSSMPVLIDLIRKVENHPEMINRDIREVVVQLVHRFKLDGIQKSPQVSASPGVVPYSPSGHQFYKHRIGLTQLLQGNAVTFPNDTLTPLERCSLHHMMSSAIELEVRNDEGTVCNQLSQYRTQRQPREAKVNADVEILDPKLISQLNDKGHMEVESDTENQDAENINGGPEEGSPRNMERTVSKCPVESGIVSSEWGAVAVGPLLQGIAAGLQPVKVPIKVLSSKATEYDGLVVDNRFALTLAGDLGEVTLFQGPVNANMKVGGSGGWNSTQASKWFFLSQSTNNEMTDAEIRGGLDGLTLAFNIQNIKSKASNMRLSQLLEMYYSQRGIALQDNIKACNRKAQYQTYAPSDTMLKQTLAMSLLLDDVTLLQGTIIDEGHKTLSTKATESLKDYIPSSLNDLSCAVTAPNSLFGDVDIRSNITIVIDKGFLFKDIEATILDILQRVNISPLGSSVTIITAKEGKILCNTTNSLATSIECFSQDNFNTMPEGVDMYKVLEAVKEMNRQALGNETIKSWKGGKSSLVLFVISQVNIDGGSYSADMLRLIREEHPDLKFLVLTVGNKDRFNALVTDPNKDIVIFSLPSNTNPKVKEFVGRVSQIPNRVINHRCGPDYNFTESSNADFSDYVAPEKINYYRLQPNYFFSRNADTHIKISKTGPSSLTLCHSRSVELPRSNSSNTDGVTCVPLEGTQEISLRDTCKDAAVIHLCAPLYFSVEAGRIDSTFTPCTDRECPQPDNIKYKIETMNLGCFSGAAQVALSAGLLIMSLLLAFTSYH